MSEVTYSLNDLKIVNTKVNLLPYKSEVEEDWTPAVDGGDCDSYATAKMQRLVQCGWPVASMRLATCFVEPSAAAEKRDRYHCVLLVDFDGQTYVLDNRHPHPMEYDLLPYDWHKFQVPGTQEWEWAKDADRSFE